MAIDRQQYNRDYYKNTLAAKRKSEREKRRAEKETAKAQQLLNERRTESQSVQTAEALARMEQRRQRDACIVAELTPPILPDETLEDGSSYHAWFAGQVQEFLDELKLGLGRHTFGAFYNAMSMEPAGQALLCAYGIEPLANAGWERFENTSSMKTLKNPPDDLGEIQARWDARGQS